MLDSTNSGHWWRVLGVRVRPGTCNFPYNENPTRALSTVTQMLLAINWRYWQVVKNSCLRMKVQGHLMKVRLIKMYQVCDRGRWRGRTPGGTFNLSIDAIFTMCSHTFTLFWLRKTSVTVEIIEISFDVFAFPPEISLILSKSFPISCVFCCIFSICVLLHFPFQYALFHFPDRGDVSKYGQGGHQIGIWSK